jgi:hypothetical protein
VAWTGIPRNTDIAKAPAAQTMQYIAPGTRFHSDCGDQRHVNLPGIASKANQLLSVAAKNESQKKHRCSKAAKAVGWGAHYL